GKSRPRRKRGEYSTASGEHGHTDEHGLSRTLTDKKPLLPGLSVQVRVRPCKSVCPCHPLNLFIAASAPSRSQVSQASAARRIMAATASCSSAVNGPSTKS